ALADRVEFALRIERQRMRGDHRALAQDGKNVLRQIGMMKTHVENILSEFRPGDHRGVARVSGNSMRAFPHAEERALTGEPFGLQESGQLSAALCDIEENRTFERRENMIDKP